ncbi:MAG TPA: cation diffusion facilitator family transporter [Bacteroidota bacterium]
MAKPQREKHPRPGKRALRIALGISATLLLVEFLGGIVTGSLALLADAGHMLTDVASLVIALIAFKFAERPATAEKTYGYYRTEILAALVNGVTLVLVALLVFKEAIDRIQSPPEVKSLPMLVIAALGLLANIASASVLARSKGQSLNLQGAWLHVMADALGSIGAITAGVIMVTTSWYLADPLISIFIAVMILMSSWKLLRDSVNILMESTPRRIDLETLEASLQNVSGVVRVHDLHVWTVTSGFDALSAHVVVKEDVTMERAQEILSELHAVVHQKFGIEHTTFQLEGQPLVQLQTPRE